MSAYFNALPLQRSGEAFRPSPFLEYLSPFSGGDSLLAIDKFGLLLRQLAITQERLPIATLMLLYSATQHIGINFQVARCLRSRITLL